MRPMSELGQVYCRHKGGPLSLLRCSKVIPSEKITRFMRRQAVIYTAFDIRLGTGVTGKKETTACNQNE
jgi:hypothetical protein